MTSDSTVVPLRQPEETDDPLTAVLRAGARRLLAEAVEAEAEAFVAAMKGLRLADGRERVVRHGHGPERLVQTGIGPVPVRQVKLRDRGADAKETERIRFTSAILPRWARRTGVVQNLLESGVTDATRSQRFRLDGAPRRRAAASRSRESPG
jgi:hypothetical protein